MGVLTRDLWQSNGRMTLSGGGGLSFPKIIEFFSFFSTLLQNVPKKVELYFPEAQRAHGIETINFFFFLW